MVILFTSVGRRVELVQMFKESAENIGIDITVIGGDCSPSAPALVFCDEAAELPRISEPGYVDSLINFCAERGVDCLIPTIDTDLLALAERREDFDRVGTVALVSTLDKVTLCRDKRLTATYLRSLGLYTPETVDDVDDYVAGYPAFIKPLDGSSSIGAFRVEDKNELIFLAGRSERYIVQPCIEGTEYTVDVFCSLDGEPVYITPRVRLAVRSGEVLKTQIDQDERIIEEVRLLLEDFRPCGPITVQLIRSAVDDRDYFIEINPRFGGGAPLSMKAGANSAEALVHMLRGENLAYVPAAAENGAMYSRFDQSVKVA